MSTTLLCPNCNSEIQISEVMESQLTVHIRAQLEGEVKARRAELDRQLVDLEKARRELSDQVRVAIDLERESLLSEAKRSAANDLVVEMKDRDDQLAQLKEKLKTAQDTELALRKERRNLEEQKQTLELTVNRRLDEERAKIRETVKTEAAEERQLKDAEKDMLINGMRAQIEELKRKSEQGSQQLQGEVLEVCLEELLRQHFPFDEISPVAKGVHGGDVIQIVRDASGTVCGIILWESKRTKSWSDGWLPKLRNDQRAAKAQVAVLVSIELPKNVTTFRHIDGIWVSSVPCSISLASALRQGLVEVAAAKRSLDGRTDKMELLYNYLSGAEFRHRVEGIVEAFVTLRQDLESEKRAIQKAWARREKQLERAVSSTSGMYGDLSGIIGGSLAKIDALEHPALEDATSTEEHAITIPE